VRRPGEDDTDLPSAVRVANDPTEGEGPLAGLHTGLMAAVRSDEVDPLAGLVADVRAHEAGRPAFDDMAALLVTFGAP